VVTSKARVIVEAMISLAHALGLEAVGEGGESAEQLEHFRSMGCDLVQGYHLARPMPNGEMDRLLETRTRPEPLQGLQGNGANIPGSITYLRSFLRFWFGK
jgi:EAL domain-containing protein (putative c-di-GMP-specific phosphodiesterase class I)